MSRRDTAYPSVTLLGESIAWFTLAGLTAFLFVTGQALSIGKWIACAMACLTISGGRIMYLVLNGGALHRGAVYTVEVVSADSIQWVGHVHLRSRRDGIKIWGEERSHITLRNPDIAFVLEPIESMGSNGVIEQHGVAIGPWWMRNRPQWRRFNIFHPPTGEYRIGVRWCQGGTIAVRWVKTVVF